MTKEIINYQLPSVPSSREDITIRKNVDKLKEKINDLNNVVLNFDTIEAIKESKQFKTDANKFVKEYKEFCDPLEQEGRDISKVRSEIKLALDKIVLNKLQPIVEVENKLNYLKDKLFIPSLDAQSCNLKIAQLKELDSFSWFAHEEQALKLIEQSNTFLENELIGFEKKAKEKAEIEQKARDERDEQIRKEAAKKAVIETENRIKLEQNKSFISHDATNEDNIIKDCNGNVSEIIAENREQFKAKIATSDKKAVHNSIIESILPIISHPDNSIAQDTEIAKNIIRAILKKEIPNLNIIY